jgi:serine/threonine-protein kinase
MDSGPTSTDPDLDSDAIDDEAERLVGTLIASKYRVLRVIGSGSTGAVYQCQHVGLDKLVALKIMHREMERDSSFVEQFKREAQAASRLEHPNSVRVLDFGQEHADHGGAFYIVMEYIEGRDLLAALDEDGPFSAERAVDVMSQILDALAVAHSLGIVHRDLKPENIVVRTAEVDGVQKELVTVCDFGIALLSPTRLSGQSASELVNLADAGMVVGTPAYMSPEQARAEPQDSRSDIYSAGVVLYQLLTLQVPFIADSPLAVAVMHCSDLPPPPSQFGAVSPALEDVCLKALSKTKEARYQNAREMKAALQRALQATPPPSNRRLTPLRWGASLAWPDAGGRPTRPPRAARSPLATPPARGRSPRQGELLAREQLPTQRQPHEATQATPASLLPAEMPAPTDRRGFRLSLPLLGIGLALLGTAAVPIFRSVGGVTGAGNTTRTMLASGEVPEAAVEASAQPTAIHGAAPDSEQVAVWRAPRRPARDTQNARPRPGPAPERSSGRRGAARSRPASPPAATSSEAEPADSELLVSKPGKPGKEDWDDTALMLRSVRAEALDAKSVSAGALPAAVPAPDLPSPSAELQPTAAHPSALVQSAPQLSAAVVVTTPESAPRPPAVPQNAQVTIGSIATRAAVSRASVRGALNLDAITDCYRAGLVVGAAPVGMSSAELVLTTNMLGGIASATLNAPRFAGNVRRCIEQVVRRGRVREVDTGSAQASVMLVFDSH